MELVPILAILKDQIVNSCKEYNYTMVCTWLYHSREYMECTNININHQRLINYCNLVNSYKSCTAIIADLLQSIYIHPGECSEYHRYNVEIHVHLTFTACMYMQLVFCFHVLLPNGGMTFVNSP